MPSTDRPGPDEPATRPTPDATASAKTPAPADPAADRPGSGEPPNRPTSDAVASAKSSDAADRPGPGEPAARPTPGAATSVEIPSDPVGPSAAAGSDWADVGLLAPVWAGSQVEAATGDAAFVRGMLDAEAALARAQAAVGLAPAAAATAVTAAAAETARYDVRDLASRARSGGNPVIPLVADLTAAVAARDSEAAPYVHRGATSQDIWDTALMLVASRALEPVLADLGRTVRALAELAVAHRDTPMAGRTLTQHAVPTTFGLKAAGWLTLAAGARDRLAAVRASLPAQLGGAAGTLAAFHAYASVRAGAAHREGDVGVRLLAAFAAETGLAEPVLPWHTLRAPIADLAGALAFTAGALGKMAADVLVLSRTEAGEVAEGQGGGSSAMPHKSNPVRAVLIAAAARQVPALTGVLHGSLAAEDERPAGAWHAEWQPAREAVRLVGGAAREAAELAEGLRVHPRRMSDNLGMTGGLVAAEHLSIALAASIGRDRAKRAVTRASRRAAEEGIDLADALAAEPDVATLLSRHDALAAEPHVAAALPHQHASASRRDAAPPGDDAGPSKENTGAPGEDGGPSEQDPGAPGNYGRPPGETTQAPREDGGQPEQNTEAPGEDGEPAGKDARAPGEDGGPFEEDAGVSWEELRALADPAGYLGSAGALVDRALRTIERTS
ncbi:3-carboxy-cis,cis-muconate cycloisomerase [Sphaerisporangium sp. NPDC005288]|uniref:3-carboxy-cis,cis-muconate cycloisomerase n=1 Tax=Sphaerisporangium sp. NPDC005288 TaxID=3155114 RepID=UPI0033A12EB1